MANNNKIEDSDDYIYNMLNSVIIYDDSMMFDFKYPFQINISKLHIAK